MLYIATSIETIIGGVRSRIELGIEKEECQRVQNFLLYVISILTQTVRNKRPVFA